MKRIVSIVLAVLFSLSVFALVGCGNINDTDVVILWKDEGVATNPNSLINSMDRAMYIEKVGYTHMGAKGNADEQLKQAKEAVESGCAVLVVELIDPLHAQEIVESAKAKEIPVVFIDTLQLVPDAVVASYDKCAVVRADLTTVAEVQGELLATYVKDNYKTLDKKDADGKTDGKITCIATDFGLISDAAVKKANELLATEDYQVNPNEIWEFWKPKTNTSIELVDNAVVEFNSIDPATLEMILTPDDHIAFTVLQALQAKDYNTDKLTTHFVPVITVGDSVDYKAYVVEQGKEHYGENKFLVDLTVVDEADLDAMIYTTRNVVGAGRLAGTVIADDDAIAGAVAKIVRNMIKEKDIFDGVEGVDGKTVKVPYIALTE